MDVGGSQELPEVGRLALKAMRERSTKWSQCSEQPTSQDRKIQESLELIATLAANVDPSKLTDDQFNEVEKTIGELVSELEGYLLHDADLCKLVGAHVQTLRDAYVWIAQGLSPDPNRRPSTKDRRLAADERAATVFDGLF